MQLPIHTGQPLFPDHAWKQWHPNPNGLVSPLTCLLSCLPFKKEKNWGKVPLRATDHCVSSSTWPISSLGDDGSNREPVLFLLTLRCEFPQQNRFHNPVVLKLLHVSESSEDLLTQLLGSAPGVSDSVCYNRPKICIFNKFLMLLVQGPCFENPCHMTLQNLS